MFLEYVVGPTLQASCRSNGVPRPFLSWHENEAVSFHYANNGPQTEIPKRVGAKQKRSVEETVDPFLLWQIEVKGSKKGIET